MREQFGLQDGLELKNLQHGKVSSRRADRFSYIIRLNPRSYEAWRDKSRSGYVFSRKSEWKVYHPSESLRSSESLLTGWTYYYPSGNIVIRVKIWSSEWNCRPGENIPSEKITIGTKTCRLNKIVPSEWKYSHPSGNIVIWVKDCLPSEKVQSVDPSESL